MSMQAAFRSAIDTLYSTFGQVVIYETPTTDAAAVTVVLTEDLSTWGEDITVVNDQIGVTVRRSDVADKPRRGDTFRLGDGSVYRVEQSLRQPNEFEWRMLAVEDGC